MCNLFHNTYLSLRCNCSSFASPQQPVQPKRPSPLPLLSSLYSTAHFYGHTNKLNLNDSAQGDRLISRRFSLPSFSLYLLDWSDAFCFTLKVHDAAAAAVIVDVYVVVVKHNFSKTVTNFYFSHCYHSPPTLMKFPFCPSINPSPFNVRRRILNTPKTFTFPFSSASYSHPYYGSCAPRERERPSFSPNDLFQVEEKNDHTQFMSKTIPNRN